MTKKLSECNCKPDCFSGDDYSETCACKCHAPTPSTKSLKGMFHLCSVPCEASGHTQPPPGTVEPELLEELRRNPPEKCNCPTKEGYWCGRHAVNIGATSQEKTPSQCANCKENCIVKCGCSDCKGKEETPEWESRFDKKFLVDEDNPSESLGGNYDQVKQFIRQVEQEAYTRGYRTGKNLLTKPK